MIRRLAGAGNDQHRGFGNERVKAAGNILLFATEPGDLLLEFRAGHDDEGLALGEPGAGGMPRQIEHALNRLWRYRLSGEVPDHPPLAYHLAEVHACSPVCACWHALTPAGAAIF